jgi:hypothetical protein
MAERSAEAWNIPPSLALATVVGGIALAVPVVAWLTQHRPWGASPQQRRFGVLCRLAIGMAALGTFYLNVSISPGGNPSAHLYVSWLTAILAGHALPKLEVSLFESNSRGRAQMCFAALLSAASAWALFGPHSNSVMIQLARRPSTLHLLALFHTEGGLDNVHATVASRAGPFFEKRDGLPAIAPTRQGAPSPPPIVIFFSMDSLRADLLTHAEHAKYLPNVGRLKAAGVSFSNARAPGSMTKYTLGAISSGKYFSQQHWSQRGKSRWPFDDPGVHLASALSGAGVFTAAFPAVGWLQAGTGLVRGFEQNARLSAGGLPAPWAHWADGKSLTTDLISTLEQNSARPCFLWVHYLDSHAPFDAGGKRGRQFERYLRALRVVDGYLGEVLEAVARLGLEHRTLVLALSDHGEGFGEHDSHFHGDNLYDELLRVPLVAKGPGVPAREIDVPVSLIDLGPTILDWFGVPTPSAFMGESLVPFLLGGSRRFSRPIVAETRLKQAMLFEDGYKVIRDLRRQTLELYDLSADPGELRNLSDHVDPDQEEHVLLLRSFFQVHTYRENGYRVPYVK